MKRAGWTRLSDPKAGTHNGHWRHSSEWEVKHCGHYTALWPYFLVDPKLPELAIVTHNRLGFQNLTLAMEAVEGIVSGRLKVIENRVQNQRFS